MPSKNHTIRYAYRYVANNIANGTVYNQARANTYSGQRVFGWRDKVRDGQDAGSPYTVDAVRFDKLVSHTVHSGTYLRRQVIGGPVIDRAVHSLIGVGGSLDLNTTITEVGSSSPQAEAQALSRLYAAIRADNSSSAGMQFLGELRETIRLIRRPGDALLKLTQHKFGLLNQGLERARRLRRRKGETDKEFRKRRATTIYNQTWYNRLAPYSDAASGTVLEWNFAIRPLLSEVKSLAISAAESVHGYAPKRVRLYGASDDFEASFSNSDPSVSYANDGVAIQYRDLVSRVTTRSVKYTVGLEPRISAPTGSLALLAERSGLQLSLENFVPTVWELFPWSFLADYFSNLGDIFEAASTSTSNIRWIVRSERTITKGKQVKHGIRFVSTNPGLRTPESLFSTDGTAGRLETTRTRLARTIPTSLPIPSLVLSLPGIGGNPWINMAALLAQQRKSIHNFLSK